MMICIVFSVFISWLENLLDDGVIEKLGVTRIKRVRVQRAENKTTDPDAPMPRKMSAIDV